MRPLWSEEEGRLHLSPLYLAICVVGAGISWLVLYGVLWLAVAIGQGLL